MGVVFNRPLQRRDPYVGLLFTSVVRLQEPILAGQQIAAHSGFHVNGGTDDGRCLAQHIVGMINRFFGFDEGADAVGRHAAKEEHEKQRSANGDENFRPCIQILEFHLRFQC